MVKWDEIRAGSKITLIEDTLFRGLCKEDSDFIIPKGEYYINGFWATACGLGLKYEDVKKCNNVYVIYSIELTKFLEVEK